MKLIRGCHAVAVDMVMEKNKMSVALLDSRPWSKRRVDYFSPVSSKSDCS